MTELNYQTIAAACSFDRATYTFLRCLRITRPTFPGADVPEQSDYCRADFCCRLLIANDQIDSSRLECRDQRITRRWWIGSTDVIVDDGEIPPTRQTRHSSLHHMNALLGELRRPPGFVARRTIRFFREPGPARPTATPLDRLMHPRRVQALVVDRLLNRALGFHDVRRIKQAIASGV